MIGEGAPHRRVEILDDETLNATWSRWGPHRVGADLHVHREHTDCFYVLDGELTLRLGLEDEPVLVRQGTLARVPPFVVHGFRNGSDAGLRYLNFHTPDSASPTTFARCATAARSRTTSTTRPRTVAGPRAGMIIGGADTLSDRPGLRVELLADVEELGISSAPRPRTEQSSPPEHLHRRHVESFYVLGGE